MASAGLEGTAFESLPERQVFKKAIDNALKDQRLPRGSNRGHHALPAIDELSDPGEDPGLLGYRRRTGRCGPRSD